MDRRRREGRKGPRARDCVGATGAKTVGEKAIGNALTNAEAALDAADQLARARTLQEAAQLQATFAQKQMEAVGEQGKALFELSLKVTKEAAEALTAIASGAAGDPRRWPRSTNVFAGVARVWRISSAPEPKTRAPS